MFAGFIVGIVAGALIGMVVTLAGIAYFSGLYREDLSKPHDYYD